MSYQVLKKDIGWKIEQCDDSQDSKYVVVICPKCGTKATLIRPRCFPSGNHTVADDGVVSPSAVCVNKNCDWHEYIRLEDWNKSLIEKKELIIKEALENGYELYGYRGAETYHELKGLTQEKLAEEINEHGEIFLSEIECKIPYMPDADDIIMHMRDGMCDEIIEDGADNIDELLETYKSRIQELLDDIKGEISEKKLTRTFELTDIKLITDVTTK